MFKYRLNISNLNLHNLPSAHRETHVPLHKVHNHPRSWHGVCLTLSHWENYMQEKIHIAELYKVKWEYNCLCNKLLYKWVYKEKNFIFSKSKISLTISVLLYKDKSWELYHNYKTVDKYTNTYVKNN